VIRAVVRRSVQNRQAILCADSCYVPDREDDPAPTNPDAPTILSALCVPIEGGHHVAGAIYLDHLSAAGAFSAEDAEIIGAVAELLALALERETVNRRLQETLLFQSALERFHSPDVARLILEQVRQDKGFENLFKEREATILFTDISGFTRLIEKVPPREAAELLNRFYDEISAIVFKYKGTVDKFIGDAVMATFGAPISYGNDAELALFAAIEIIRRTSEFQPAPPSRLRFQVRIGVNTGMVISGYVGSRRRLDYTVLGDPVNVAARLTDLAQPGTVWVGEETYAKARGIFSFKHRGATLLKGKKSEINVYEVSF
jgi:adenylate cyclase